MTLDPRLQLASSAIQETCIAPYNISTTEEAILAIKQVINREVRYDGTGRWFTKSWYYYSLNEFKTALEEYGMEFLGRGCEATVFTNPTNPYTVLKVIRVAANGSGGQLDFSSWLLLNNNHFTIRKYKHVPYVESITKIDTLINECGAEQDVYVIVQERYDCTLADASTLSEACQRQLKALYRILGKPRKYLRENTAQLISLSKYSRACPIMNAELKFYASDRTMPEFIDVHSANIMVDSRRDCLVIVDPTTEESYRESPSKIAKELGLIKEML